MEVSHSLSNYEKRVVAFVDILGFRSLVTRMATEPDLFETIRDALESVMEYGIMSRQAVVLNSHYRESGIEMSAFSDCYAISARVGEELLVLNVTRQLVLCLLEVGVISRGAVVVGDLYHQHPVVFGQALVDAYELESSAANYPRVLVTEEVVSAIHEIDGLHGTTYAESIIRDSDGCWFIDAFWLWPKKYTWSITSAEGKAEKVLDDSGHLAYSMDVSHIDVFKRIRGHLVTNLLRATQSGRARLNHLLKLRWLAARFNEAMASKRAVKIEPIDVDAPKQEKEWEGSRWLREDRSLRLIKQPFTLEDLLRVKRRRKPRNKKR